VPYSDRWGITATKVTGGTYTVIGPGGSPTATVPLQQVFPNELINVAGALMLAIQALYPFEGAPWINRYLYALARWKLDAYASLISGASGQTRTALTAKRNYWVAEEARLKAIMGSDA
jgi:hypothetical protein